MSKNKAAKTTVLPLKAQEEILEKLFDQMYISKEDVDAITERYGISGDIVKLQQAYRRQQAQRFLSGLRDDDGVRLVMSVRGSKYVLIDYCNDRSGLTSLHQRIQSQMKGLDRSDGKVMDRIEKLKGMIARFTRQESGE